MEVLLYKKKGEGGIENAYSKRGFLLLNNVRYGTGKQIMIHVYLVFLVYNSAKLATDCIKRE